MYALKDSSCLQNVNTRPETLAGRSVKWGRFFKEIIIKEFGACLKHTWYRFLFTFTSSGNLLNHFPVANPSYPGKKARVLVLLHGMGGHGSCFLPLANSLKSIGLEGIYTVSLTQSEEDPVPITKLENTLYHLRRTYRKKGYSDVQFGLIGHSLGALAGAKYAWRKWRPSKDPVISFVVSLGGRLKYLDSPFSWFCEDVRPEIEKTYEAILDAPFKTRLYSLWGEKDALVPRKSAHPFGNHERELTIRSCGHSGIVFSQEAHRKILAWVQDWVFENT